MDSLHPLTIIGSGPAGYTAAIYAARAGLSPRLFVGNLPGGQLMLTTDVENFPGFSSAIQGPFLMEQMHNQAKHVGTEIYEEQIRSLSPHGSHFEIVPDRSPSFLSQAVILATGAQAKWLDLPSEKIFQGYGVSACATCDGFFFKEKIVAVIGGGNSALEEALFLTQHASHVILIHRRDEFKGEKILQDRVFSNPKIEILWNSRIEEIIGVTRPIRKVTQIRIENTVTKKTSFLEVAGVFVAIGHTPITELVQGWVKLDRDGYVEVAPGTVLSSYPGMFVAGDVADKRYRQAVTAAGMGCMAALDAARFLRGEKIW